MESAQTGRDHDGEVDQASERGSSPANSVDSRAMSTSSSAGITPTKRAGPGQVAGGGGSGGSRRSRRKQSDPRRLDSDPIKLEIKTEEFSDDDDGVCVSKRRESAGRFDEDVDDVFLKVRTKTLSSSFSSSPQNSDHSGSDSASLMPDRRQERSVSTHSDQRDISVRMAVNDDDCQPEDLSVGKKRRDSNRVVLAVPSVIRPTNCKTVTKSRPRGHPNSPPPQPLPYSLDHSSARHFRTLSTDSQSDQGLVALERDYRLKYGHDYHGDFHERRPDIGSHHEYSAPVPLSLAHHQRLAFESDGNSRSPDNNNDDHQKETNGRTSPSTSTSSTSSTSQSSKPTRNPPRSYKNLSRSRRIVANARERNRVHTISAAFEGLRRAVPSYSHNQKLSKLAILRIACSYILALARLADLDYSPDDEQQMSFEDCVDLCTETLQAEGRSKRRKGPME